jgi:hypothetical protein
MGLIQREMVAHSRTMVTIDAVEHSRAVHADGQGWSASGSSAGQPDRADGLRPSWARSPAKSKTLRDADESLTSRGGSGAVSSGEDARGHWLTLQGHAEQMNRLPGLRPSWARPPAKPKILLDANEQRSRTRVDISASGVSADGRSAVCSGATGRGAVGRGSAGSGAVGRGSVGCGALGNGVVGSGADGSGAGGSCADENGAVGSDVDSSTEAAGGSCGRVSSPNTMDRRNGNNGSGRIGDDCNCDSDCGADFNCTEWGHCGQLLCDGNGECSILVGFAFMAFGTTVEYSSPPTAAATNTSGPIGNMGWAAMGAMALGLANRRRQRRNKQAGSRGVTSNSQDGLAPWDRPPAASAAGLEVHSDEQLILAPNTASGYRGVSYDSDRGTYRAVAIAKGRKRVRLGDFTTAEEAVRCYTNYVRDRDETTSQPTTAVDDNQVVWQLHLAPGTQTGYKGVERRQQTAKLQRPFRARHDRCNIGNFMTAIEAALAYAKHVSAQRVADTDTMLNELQRLAEINDDARGMNGIGANDFDANYFSAGIGVSNTGANVSGDGGVQVSWVSTELLSTDGGAEGCSMHGSCGQCCSWQNRNGMDHGNGCGDIGCGPSCSNQSSSDLGWSALGCGDLGCSNQVHTEQDYGETISGEAGCGGVSCGDVSCGGLGCGELGCGSLSCGDLSCDDLSCGGLSCSDLGCGRQRQAKGTDRAVQSGRQAGREGQRQREAKSDRC